MSLQRWLFPFFTCLTWDRSLAADPGSASGLATSLQLPRTVSRFQIFQAETAARLRYIDAEPGAVVDRDLHYKFLARARWNLSANGNTYAQVRCETGNTFHSDMDYVGFGRRTGSSAFNLKSLFPGYRFSPGAELQVGGIDCEYDAESQATYADVDGRLEGYRIRFIERGGGMGVLYVFPQHAPLPEKKASVAPGVDELPEERNSL